LKENWLFKAKTTMYSRVYNVYRSKIYNNKSTKTRDREMGIHCSKGHISGG
jgi:hypothetical protein